MNILKWLLGRPVTRLEDLLAIQTFAEQVVLAVEQTVKLPGSEKKIIAMELLAELLKDSGLDPPLRFMETAIEAAVRLKNLTPVGSQPDVLTPTKVRIQRLLGNLDQIL